MKYLVSLLAGLLAGIALFLLALYHNPFFDRPALSPLSVTDMPLTDLSWSAVPADAIAYTNNGDGHIKPAPENIETLWEPALRKTRVLVTVLSDSRGQAAGLGIKFTTDSEESRLLRARALADSAWHLWLPGRGTLLVGQTENFWSYLRNVLLPARWNSANNWRGTWFGVTTTGPTALGTGRVWGASGRYAGHEGEAVESLSARAYSGLRGPVAMSGNLSFTSSEPAAAD